MKPNLVTVPEAVQLLNSEKVVAIPTETVYGLAGLISSETALKAIFETKKRPFFDPLIVHVGSIYQAQSLVLSWPPIADLLAKKFWPGPLTLILPKKPEVSSLITSGLETLALRWPRHPITQSLLDQLKQPFAAPSANLFGKTSPTSAEHVLSEFSNEVAVLDGGPCQVGIESTILQIEEEAKSAKLSILRPGMITDKDIREALASYPKPYELVHKESSIAPGHLKHHYQPRLPLALLFNSKQSSEPDILGITKKLGLNLNAKHFDLKLNQDPKLAARELYQKLREADQSGKDFIFCQLNTSDDPNWTGILDRLKKASTLVKF